MSVRLPTKALPTALLLAVAAGLWGAVLVRLHAGLADPPPAPEAAPYARTAPPDTLPRRGPGFDPQVRNPFSFPEEAPSPRVPPPRPAPEAASSPTPFTLEGIVGRTALVRTPDTRVHLLTPGDTLSGWRVLRIHPDRLTLRHSTHTRVLRMSDV